MGGVPAALCAAVWLSAMIGWARQLGMFDRVRLAAPRPGRTGTHWKGIRVVYRSHDDQG